MLARLIVPEIELLFISPARTRHTPLGIVMRVGVSADPFQVTPEHSLAMLGLGSRGEEARRTLGRRAGPGVLDCPERLLEFRKRHQYVTTPRPRHDLHHNFQVGRRVAADRL